MEQVCARHIDGTDPRLPAETARLARIVGEAESAGLAHVLRKTEREWAHFQSVADWVCGQGAGIGTFAAAITALRQAIDRVRAG